jgi:flagellar biosynthesis protein FlhG
VHDPALAAEEIGMSDQADRLRQLVVASRGATVVAAPAALAKSEDDDVPAPRPQGSPRTTRSLLFTSGKGGVGTSNLVLNLAIALGELGERVLVIDADIGLANLDLLCGLAPRFDLGDVLAGRCTLADAVMTGPDAIRIVPGAHAIRTGAEMLEGGPARLVEELGELESESDFVLVDAGSGLGPGATKLAAAADSAVIVTTPEPTSLADAHAAIARFRRLPAPPRLRVVVNQARTGAEASEVLDRLVASSRQFLGVVVTPLGSGAVRADPHVGLAVRGRRPFLTAYPGTPASRGVRRLARALARERIQPQSRGRRSGFFAGLAARWALGLVATG